MAALRALRARLVFVACLVVLTLGSAANASEAQQVPVKIKTFEAAFQGREKRG